MDPNKLLDIIPGVGGLRGRRAEAVHQAMKSDPYFSPLLKWSTAELEASYREISASTEKKQRDNYIWGHQQALIKEDVKWISKTGWGVLGGEKREFKVLIEVGLPPSSTDRCSQQLGLTFRHADSFQCYHHSR